MLTEGQARARLQRMVCASFEPTLTTDEVSDLLLGARRPDKYGIRADDYTTWTANLAVAVGDHIVPSTRNGHFYTVTASDGAAGTTEPVWPTTTAATVTTDGVTYTEGGTVTWTPTWDLNAAAAEGWLWKAGKVAGEFNFGSDRQTFSRSEANAMCQRQHDFYRKKIVGSFPISAGWLRRRGFYDVVGNAS